MVLPFLSRRHEASFADVDRVVYCIGAQKAGTTWLHAQLAAHPDVHVPVRKEVHYWDTIHPPHLPHYRQNALSDLAALRALGLPRRIVRDARGIGPADARRYHDLLHVADPGHLRYQRYMMHGARGQRVVADISPGYAMLDATGFAQMRNVAPDARFVFILRDPVSRLWSALRHNRARGFLKPEAARDLNATMARMLDRPGKAPMRMTDYAATIATLETVVPGPNIAYFFFETLFTAAEMARLAVHIGVGRIDAAFGTRVNAGSDGGSRPDKAVSARARAVFAPVYAAIADRFGDRVPAEWGRTAEGRDERNEG